MTTQNAGTSADGPIDPDEAERLASRIRPAWELDGDADVEAGLPAKPRTMTLIGGSQPPPAPPAGAEPARDTEIDGVPSIQVGATGPGPDPLGATIPVVDRADMTPGYVGPTQVGVAPPSEHPPKVQIAEAVMTRPTPSEPGLPLPPKRPSPDSLRATSTRNPRPAVSPSSFDDPIEIPTTKGSRVAGYVAAAAVAVCVLGVVGWFASRDSAPARPLPQKTAENSAAQPLDRTEEPRPAATATTAASVAPAATATATTAASVAPAEVLSAAPIPVAAPPPDKPAAKPISRPVAAAPKPAAPPKATSKPKPAGGGGIMRDAPF